VSRGGRGHQLPDRVEDDSELRVVLLFERIELAGQLFVRERHLTEANEGAHDRDVDVDRALTSEHARQHRNAMFGESVWEEATPTAPLPHV